MINFKCPFTFKKQFRSLSRTHKFQKRSTQIFTTCRIKLDVKKYVSVNAFTTLMPVNLSILIIKKFIKPITKFFKKPGSSHFLIIFWMPWELSHLTSKDFLFVSLFPYLFAWKKKIKMVNAYSLLRYLSSNNPETWLARIIKDW